MEKYNTSRFTRDEREKGFSYTFKKYLLDYYFSALECNYNIDDPRSWKTICLKCNQTHDLTKPLTCCF